MILYVNGCSHSDDLWQERDEKHNGSFVWSHHLMESLCERFKYFRIFGNSMEKRPKIDGEDLKFLDINQLEHIQDNILINDSVSGAGNDRIFHTSLESLNKLIKVNKTPELVVIQWSGVNRREYCDIDGKPLFVSPHDNIDLHMKFEPMATTHTAHYIFTLQEFLKKHKINYYFFTYMGLDHIIKKLHIYDSIDMDRIIDFGNDTLYNGLIDLFKSKGFNRDVQGHCNEMGAKFISDMILNKI